jgi:hypothetical protein
MLIQRGMTLTALAKEVGVTQANISILKTNKLAPSASRRWKRSVRYWTANKVICWNTNLMI